MIARLVMLAGALAIGSAATGQTTTQKYDAVSGLSEIDKTTQTQDVNLRSDKDERMLVPVKLSGAGPYYFLVDTGADRTAVSREIADKLQLQTGQGAQLHTITGVSEVRTAKVNEVEFTQRPQKSIDAAVLEGAYMGADGIVGVDLLRSERVQFDFEKQTMSVVPAATPDFRTEPGTIVIEARRKNGRLIVTDAVANGEHVVVVLDTGSDLCLGNEALRAKLLGRNFVDADHKVELESVTGAKISGDYTVVRNLTIADVQLSNLAVVFTDAHTFHQLGLDRKPALLLGMNALRAFKKVSIDFANKKFRVVLPEHSQLESQLAAAGGL
jgi:predicted aspartyl protease